MTRIAYRGRLDEEYNEGYQGESSGSVFGVLCGASHLPGGDSALQIKAPGAIYTLSDSSSGRC